MLLFYVGRETGMSLLLDGLFYFEDECVHFMNLGGLAFHLPVKYIGACDLLSP